MEPLKLRLLNKFGNPENLANPDDIEVHFPYDNTEALVKRMSNGHVRILNSEKGEIEVTLSPFEVQGLKTGRNQNFSILLITGSKIRHGVFSRALHVETQIVDGNERKVVVRK